MLRLQMRCEVSSLICTPCVFFSPWWCRPHAVPHPKYKKLIFIRIVWMRRNCSDCTTSAAGFPPTLGFQAELPPGRAGDHRSRFPFMTNAKVIRNTPVNYKNFSRNHNNPVSKTPVSRKPMTAASRRCTRLLLAVIPQLAPAAPEYGVEAIGRAPLFNRRFAALPGTLPRCFPAGRSPGYCVSG